MRASLVAACLLVAVLFSVAVEAHMTEFCFVAMTNAPSGERRMKVLVEHWHGTTQALVAAANFRIIYPVGAPPGSRTWDYTASYSEVFQPNCASGCPTQCTTSYDCGNESDPGHWGADVVIPDIIPDNAVVTVVMRNGGVITENQGACAEWYSTSFSQGQLQIPPPGCLGDICGDGVIATPVEQCEFGPPAAFGGATCLSLGFLGGGTLTCTTCCRFDTSQCIPCGNMAFCRSHTEVLNASGSGTITFAEVDSGASIVCDGFSASVSPSSVGCNNAGNTIAVTLTIGAATCVSAVSVVDNSRPTLTCPPAATVNTDSGVCTSTANTGTATIADNCPGSTVSRSPTPPYPLGTTTVTWSGQDNSGNNAFSCTQQVTVRDNQNPVISCPPAIGINTDPGFCTSSTNIGFATATDNCAVQSITELPSSPYSLGSTTVQWRAVDNSGNAATCTHVVTVSDNELPGISCPLDISIPTDNNVCTSSSSIGSPVVTDNCPGVAATNIIPGPYNLGDTSVVWQATDSTGNTASCMHVVTVYDNQNPVINVPADQTINIDQGPTVDLSHPDVTCADNCGCTVAHVSGPMQGDPLTPGQYVITWSSTDSDGNVVFGSWTVSVTGFSITSPSVGASIYMYIPTEIDFTYYPPGADTVEFELVSDDLAMTQNYYESIPATTNVVVVHQATPGYWRVRMTAQPSGVSSLGPLVRLCVGGWEGGECLLY